MQKSRELLKRYWGYDSFRPLQEEIVDSIIYGSDTLAILPTGGGKSICFQVPGMALDGLTLVISPLIALMQDQVDQLAKRGIKASMIRSGMSYREIDITLDNARFGGTKFLYTSPERLKTSLFLERFKEMNVSLIVIDEAHCISQWGHDFRPAYLEISSIKELHPECPLVAVTASATNQVQKDIIDQLTLKSPKIFKGSLSRSNLHYAAILSDNKLNSILNYCNNRIQESGIVYCQTRKSVKHVVQQLRAKKISAGFYHGGLNTDDRKYMMENWLNGNIHVMVATNAFGMGIDKPNVRYVLHYEVPSNIEAYYQEAGRAGRDEKSANAIIYWEPKDLDQLKDRLKYKFPPKDRIKQIYSSICNFLTIAIESGEGETFDLDIKRFASMFHFSISEIFYSLKVLENNSSLVFTEQSFHPTRLKIAIGQSALYKFQVGHDKVSSILMLLTRSYPGLFDRFITINESELSKRLKITFSDFREQLLYLEQYGVIDLSLQSNLPQITLLHGRYLESKLSIDQSIYEQKQQAEESKLNSLIKYIKTTSCRSVEISNYFNADSVICKVCDNCLENMSSTYTQKELYEIIPTLLPSNLDQLSNKLAVKESIVKKAIQHLILEELIIFNGENYQTTNS
ncbi:MAG: RecQ family ATP-dependent DNA helicase [Crocinitomicaceae bacterium]|nr:RecQ family ATP-dependent DNA helicase [Crocinitomicaceae bacterium]